jgi:hypothetical protein
MTLEEMAMVTGGADSIEEVVVTAKPYPPTGSCQVSNNNSVDKLLMKLDAAGKNVCPNPSVDDVAHKDGVDLSHLSVPMKQALTVVKEVFAKNKEILVVTSANDGQHMDNSKHYTDNAVDVRANTMTDAKQKQIASELQSKLGSNYYVGAEFFANPANDHIHVEYDPPKH